MIDWHAQRAYLLNQNSKKYQLISKKNELLKLIRAKIDMVDLVIAVDENIRPGIEKFLKKYISQNGFGLTISSTAHGFVLSEKG